MGKDFGHFYYRDKTLFIDSWGSGPFIICVGGQKWRFEDSDHFGPMMINKDETESKKPLPETKSPFWPAYKKWRDAGRPMAKDGVNCAV